MSNSTTVYVALTGSGVDLWRPVHAEHVAGDVYRLTEEQADGELWSFGFGDVVRCKEHRLAGNGGRWVSGLCAYEKLT